MTVQQSIQLNNSLSGLRRAWPVLWVPCVATLLYLSGSLLLFKFGPVEWPIQNGKQFWLYNMLYLVMFLTGYGAALRLRHKWVGDWNAPRYGDLAARFFWPIWACAALVVLIGHRNLTMGPSYVPVTLFSDVISGWVDPLGAYLYKLSEEAQANFSGNLPLTLVFGLLAFSKLVLVYLLVSNWPSLSRLKRVLGVVVAIFPVLSGVSVGTNKPIFDVAFTFITLILTYLFLTPRGARLEFVRARKSLMVLAILISVFAGTYFQHTMNARAPGMEYAKSLSATGLSVRLKPAFEDYCKNANEWTAKGCHLFSIGTIYLTQGYYGMSLSLDIPLETTYGLGNSQFVINALNKYLGFDLAPKTFQQKIDEQWSAAGQWHSAYSQWANDVGFQGVAFVMLVLGFYVCAIWASAVQAFNPAAVCSIPLLVTMIVFIPANNQVFNILESMAAFIVLFVTWVVGVVFRSRIEQWSRANIS